MSDYSLSRSLTYPNTYDLVDSNLENVGMVWAEDGSIQGKIVLHHELGATVINVEGWLEDLMDFDEAAEEIVNSIPIVLNELGQGSEQ
jgi:hypothetical protein